MENNYRAKPYINYLAKKMAAMAKSNNFVEMAAEPWEHHIPYARILFEICSYDAFTSAELKEIADSEAARVQAMTDDELRAEIIAEGRDPDAEAQHVGDVIKNAIAAVFWYRPQFPPMLDSKS